MLLLPATSITDLVDGAAGLVVVLSGLAAAGMRSLATLLGLPSERVERATAVGFLAGAAIALLLLLGDVVSKG